MEREKVIELSKKAGFDVSTTAGILQLGIDTGDDQFSCREEVLELVRLVEQETLERALMECEAMRDDMVKIKCSNQQIYGASQAVETIRSLKLPTN